MLEQFSRLSDGDYEQSAMVQLFLDCVDRATVSSTAFVSFLEQPMHFNDNQALSYESLIQLQMTVFGRLLMTGATVVVMLNCGDKMLKHI